MARTLCLLMLLALPVLAAQNASDSGAGGDAAWLRQAVLARWRGQVRNQLQLSDTQAAQLHATEDRFFERRREIALRQRSVVAALRDELQPGVAANPDSVRRLMDARDENRAALVSLEHDEDAEMAGYLNPVQRARYQLMRQRLQERITEMRRERRERLRGRP